MVWMFFTVQPNPVPVPVAQPVAQPVRRAREPIRDFRPRGQFYTQAQKDQAIRMLNSGTPCRQVARLVRTSFQNA